MPTPGEQRALVFLAAVAALGVAARGWQSHKATSAPLVAGDAAGLARQIEAVDSAIASGGARRGRGRGAPPSSLPKGAKAVARATALQVVAAAPAVPVVSEPPDNRAKYLARWARADSIRGAINARQAPPTVPRMARMARGARAALSAPVDVDVASVEEIGAVPAIGAALARRIVADRIEHGPFGSADELQRVRGLSPSLARRLSPYITFSRAPITSLRVDEPKKQSAPRRRRKQP